MRDSRPIWEMSVEDRVALGAAELDAVMPGWFTNLKPRQLRLESTCNCVLAQLDPSPKHSYWSGRSRLFGSRARKDRWVERRGFVSYQFYDEYPGLTRAWKKEIAARKRAARKVAA